MRLLRRVLTGLLLSSLALGGLPPTTSRDSTDSSNVTTFNFQFPNFTGTHTGTTFSLGVNGIAGGGTNSSAALTNGFIMQSLGGSIVESPLLETDVAAAVAAVLSGNPNTFAAFDGSGLLSSAPGWGIDSTGQATAFLGSVGPVSATSFQLGATIPSPMSGGYEGVIVSSDFSSTMAFQSSYNVENSYNSGFVMSGSIDQYQDQSAINAGSDVVNYTSFNSVATFSAPVTGGLRSFTSGDTVGSALGGFIGFSEASNFNSGGSITGDYQGLALTPDFHTGFTLRSLTGVNVAPQLPDPVTDDVTGVRISLQNTVAGGNVLGLSVNVNGAVDGNPQGPKALEVGGRIDSNSNNQLVAGQGFQIGNRVESLLHVPVGSPVTGTDSLGNNFAGDLEAEDNIAVGPINLGWNSVGFIASVAVAAGKTVDKASVFLPAMSLPDPGSFATGGAINDLAMIRVYSPLAQGGTATFTDVYGLQINPQFGNLPGTNTWGVWVGDTAADNWFNKDVVIGGATGKPTGAYSLDVTGDSRQKGLMGLEGSTSGLFTQSAAATTTPYGVVWPAAQGGAGTVPTNDGAGNLSWTVPGAVTYSSSTLANNQSTPANVTGFSFDAAINHGFVSDISIVRTTSDSSPVGGVDTGFEAAIGTGANAQVIFAIRVDPSSSDLIVGGQFTGFGTNSAASLVRLNKLGFQNSTFVTNIGTGFNDQVKAVVVDSTGKIRVGGEFTAFNGNTRRKLIGLNADGTEDSTFVSNVGTRFPSSTPQSIFGLGMQSDDKIVVVGNFSTYNGGNPARVVRLNSDGTEDTAFSANVGTGLDLGAQATVIQADGKILIGGAFTTVNGVTVGTGITRLNSDGTLDTTFNTNVGTGVDTEVLAIAEQADTKIVVTGSFTAFNGNSRNGIVRLNSDGTEDTTFYTNAGTALAGTGSALTLQADQKIVVGGSFTNFNGNGLGSIARINTDGSEDTAFTALAGSGPNNAVLAAATNTNGAVIIGGVFTTYNSASAPQLLEFGVDHELDQVMTIYGTYSQSQGMWKISSPIGAFDDAGVALSISTSGTSGQIQYTSTNMPGTPVIQEVRWLNRSL